MTYAKVGIHQMAPHGDPRPPFVALSAGKHLVIPCPACGGDAESRKVPMVSTNVSLTPQHCALCSDLRLVRVTPKDVPLIRFSGGTWVKCDSVVDQLAAVVDDEEG